MTQRGPWQVRGSREVYRNRWLRVREDDVIRPDGQPGIYGVIEPEDNAAIVALDDAGRVALVGEFLYPLAVQSWQIPSGGINAGEPPLAAAMRELRRAWWGCIVRRVCLNEVRRPPARMLRV